MAGAFVLVHSPLVGPETWELVGDWLRTRGHEVVVPTLGDDGDPRWAGHVRSVVSHVPRAVSAASVVLVAHSGAGQLLALVGRSLAEEGVTVGGYVLVDAGLPTDGASRLGQIRAEDPDRARGLEELLRAGGRFPDWSADDLAPEVPDADLRQRLLDGLRPQPLDYWTEPMPAVETWPDAPCGVVLLSDGYAATEDRARRQGWPLRDLRAGNHFLTVTDPGSVGAALLEVVNAMAGRD